MPYAMHKAIMRYAHVRHDMKATLTLNVLKVCNFFVECVIIINSIISLKFTCVQMHYVSNNEIFLEVRYEYEYNCGNVQK